MRNQTLTSSICRRHFSLPHPKVITHFWHAEPTSTSADRCPDGAAQLDVGSMEQVEPLRLGIGGGKR